MYRNSLCMRVMRAVLATVAGIACSLCCCCALGFYFLVRFISKFLLLLLLLFLLVDFVIESAQLLNTTYTV